MAQSVSGMPRRLASSKSFPHDGRVHLLAVSTDGAHIATAVQRQGASVSVWDVATGVLRQRWPGNGDVNGSLALAFSRDGEYPARL